MRELGAHEQRLHEDVARAALASPVELIGGVGAFGTALEILAPKDPRVVTGADPAAVWSGLAGKVAPDAVILLKGSRGVRLEQLVPAIKKWAGIVNSE
jgi:UDP-N-acetylmuramoyl-tripeptide--D-alanyl-D-alanine ligase